MVKIVTETYILDDRGFHYKVGDDIAFEYKGATYVGIVTDIGDTSFKCKDVLKDMLETEDKEFSIKDVSELTYTSVD